jgi:hypothetical protein
MRREHLYLGVLGSAAADEKVLDLYPRGGGQLVRDCELGAIGEGQFGARESDRA